MKLKFLRLIAFVLFFLFLFHQLSFAYPISVQPLAIDSKPDSFSSFINQLNPVTGYQSLFKSVTAGVIESASGFTRLLTNVAEKLGVQIALQKIDQSLEKSKLNSFTKALLSTVASVGIQALGSSLSEGFGSIQGSGSIEAAGARAPPTGLAGFFSQIGSALSSVGGIITSALKDTTGFIKSLFIQDDGLTNAKITFNNNGEVNYYDSLDDLLDLQYSVDPLSSSVSRSDLDGGDYQYLGFDPNTNAVTSNERVGNLWDHAIDFGDSLLNQILSDPFTSEISTNTLINPASSMTERLAAGVSLLIPRNFKIGISESISTAQLILDRYSFLKNEAGYDALGALAATSYYTAGDFIGFTPLAESWAGVDTLGQDLTTGQRALKFGEFAIGLGLSFVGGGVATKGAASTAVRNRVLANLAESKTARLASKFDIHLAQTAQLKGGYLPDAFGLVTLKKGSIVYSGLPGQSAFYTDFATAKTSGLDKIRFSELSQIAPHPLRGYRSQVGAHRVLEDIRVPSGIARANPQFGSGEGLQYFIRKFENKLKLIRVFNKWKEGGL